MYERSAIVLERYLEKILNLNKEYNLKDNYNNFTNIIEEIEKYQSITIQETNIIQEFDSMAEKIQEIQKKQEKISKINQKLENDRIKMFSDLGENSTTLESKLNKIEETINKNNEELKTLKSDFVKYLSDFSERQKERNKCEKARRIGEANHIEYLKNTNEAFKQISPKDCSVLKDFIESDKSTIKEEIEQIMIKNGKNERIPFNEDILKKAIRVRISIAEREAECYVLAYDKMRRLLVEIENDNFKLEKYKKAQKNICAKLAFLNSEKEYIAEFLDYERMTTTTGPKAHKKMMEQACNNFELDIIQIDKLYELLLREIANKSTKKAYEELYNKTYLKNIEDKEKNFEQEVNSIQVKMATVINSNYWRIEGIKNIYNVFQEEVTTKFNKDLSEYKIENEEVVEEDYYEDESDVIKDNQKKSDEEDYYDDEEEFDDAGYEENDDFDEEFEDDYNDEEENDQDENDEIEDENEFDDDLEYDEYNEEDDEFEDDEYDDEFEDDEYDDEDDEYDDEFEDDENDEYDEEDEDEFEDDEYDDEDEDEFEEDEYNGKENKKNNPNKAYNRKYEEDFDENEDYVKYIVDKLNNKNNKSKKRNILDEDKKQNNIFDKIFKDRKNKKAKK